MERYTRTKINNPTENQKEEELRGYKEIASVKIFFNGKGGFIANLEANNGFTFVTDIAGKPKEEAKAVLQNTLGNAAEQLLDYLKGCYAKSINSTTDEFIEILRKMGVFRWINRSRKDN